MGNGTLRRLYWFLKKKKKILGKRKEEKRILDITLVPFQQLNKCLAELKTKTDYIQENKVFTTKRTECFSQQSRSVEICMAAEEVQYL